MNKLIIFFGIFFNALFSQNIQNEELRNLDFYLSKKQNSYNSYCIISSQK